MLSKRIGILGATSLVGGCLVENATEQSYQVVAFSRKAIKTASKYVNWVQLASFDTQTSDELVLPFWISVAPLWVLPDYFPMLEAVKVRRIIALSSTSLFTKADSGTQTEQTSALLLAEGERRLEEWADNKGIEWVVLRPTMIYGMGRDKNIAEIMRFIRRFGFFPLFGKASGLRQPIHAEDVANACLKALQNPQIAHKAYNISGGESLPYRELVIRVFKALHREPLVFTIPMFVFKLGIEFLRLFPRYRSWSVSMVERMNRDLVFSHEEATRDFDFKPRMFDLAEKDLNEIAVD